jgi:hypothetical protein
MGDKPLPSGFPLTLFSTFLGPIPWQFCTEIGTMPNSQVIRGCNVTHPEERL